VARAAVDVLTSLEVGIYVFFVLSGYLLARAFVAAFHHGTDLPRPGRYMLNRLLRIVPAFWFVALLTLVYFGRRGSSWGDVAAVLGFAQTWTGKSPFQGLMLQAWTLGAELLFYLALPIGTAFLVVTLGRLPRGPLRLAVVTGVLAAGALLSFVVRVTGAGAHESFHTPPTMLFAFAPGILLAAVEVLGVEGLRGWRLGRPASVAAVVAGLALLGVYSALDRDSVAARLIVGMAGCSLLVAGPLLLQWTTGSAARALDNRPMHWLGVRSYSIYLVHVGVLLALDWTYDNEMGLWPAFGLTVLVAVPVTVLLAALVYRFVEAPFLALRTRRLVRSRPEAAGLGAVETRPQTDATT
jgi:peptidoglycan/LPS O-acetylase OafA/YrhL